MYLILDELGELELKNQELHLIIIVRDSLLEEVISHYKITKYSVIKKEDLERLK